MQKYENFWNEENARFLLKYDKNKAKQIIDNILGDISKYNNIMEYGCGAGRFIDYLRNLYPDKNFTGVDFSRKMCILATKRFKRFKNILICKNNGKDLSYFKDNKFDLIYSIVVFQHIPTLGLITSLLKEICRISYGKILIQFSNKKPHYITSNGTSLHGYRMSTYSFKCFIKNYVKLENFTIHETEFMKKNFWFLLEINKCT